MGLPCSEKRLLPSGINPLPCVARIAVHRLVLRDRHALHCRHACGLDFDQHFAGSRTVELYRFHRQRRACLMRDRSTNIHRLPRLDACRAIGNESTSAASAFKPCQLRSRLSSRSSADANGARRRRTARLGGANFKRAPIPRRGVFRHPSTRPKTTRIAC
jgi:hypothetical protein